MSLCSQLEGKKTYTVAAAIAVLAVLQTNGLVDAELANQLWIALNAAGLAALRSGITTETTPNA